MSGVGLNLSLGANIIEDYIRDVLEPLSNGFVSSGCFAMRNVTRCYAKKTAVSGHLGPVGPIKTKSFIIS